jgi:predicted GIY-YIG superfamily endonuclease
MERFNIKYSPKGKTVTLFKYRYLVLDKRNREMIDFSRISEYLGKYMITVTDNVIDKYSGSVFSDVLADLQSGEHSLVLSNPEDKSGQYLRCMLERETTGLLKKLFLSTLVFDNEGMDCPVQECVEISFDTNNKTETIINLDLYIPTNDPYYKYAQRAAVNMSVETIGLCNYSKKEVKNFYDITNVGKWKPVSYLEKEKGIRDASGIYMLYNAPANALYIGKAVRLKERIEQHRKDASDYMQDFTHYRYSVVADEYFEFLYLLENAAIHDVAQILEMPGAKTYKSPLIKIATDISSCTISNRVEYQTKKQS